jgi:hypothetical protein
MQHDLSLTSQISRQRGRSAGFALLCADGSSHPTAIRTYRPVLIAIWLGFVFLSPGNEKVNIDDFPLFSFLHIRRRGGLPRCM